jgi:hypothetical protein
MGRRTSGCSGAHHRNLLRVSPTGSLLQVLRLRRTSLDIRSFAKNSIEPFLWANTAWLTLPFLLIQYAIWGNLGWRWLIALIVTYVLVALVLHSTIAHSTEGVFQHWESRLRERAA